MSSENANLKEKLEKRSLHESRGKNKSSNLQLELQESLSKFKENPAASLERNAQLKRDLIHVKEEFEKSLKWNTLSQILANLTSQMSTTGNV